SRTITPSCFEALIRGVVMAVLSTITCRSTFTTALDRHAIPIASLRDNQRPCRSVPTALADANALSENRPVARRPPPLRQRALPSPRRPRPHRLLRGHLRHVARARRDGHAPRAAWHADALGSPPRDRGTAHRRSAVLGVRLDAPGRGAYPRGGACSSARGLAEAARPDVARPGCAGGGHRLARLA